MNSSLIRHDDVHYTQRIYQICRVRHSTVRQQTFGTQNSINNSTAIRRTGDYHPCNANGPNCLAKSRVEYRYHRAQVLVGRTKDHSKDACWSSYPTDDQIFLQANNSKSVSVSSSKGIVSKYLSNIQLAIVSAQEPSGVASNEISTNSCVRWRVKIIYSTVLSVQTERNEEHVVSEAFAEASTESLSCAFEGR